MTDNTDKPAPIEQLDMMEYLLAHEGDIYWGINDFGELRDVFVSTFKRQPKKDAG